MPLPDAETELDQSKMSFGEHLEELRAALFKSLFALAVGFAIGLLFGWSIVDYIQGPLRDALENYYLQQAETKQLERWADAKARGLEAPDDPASAAAEMVGEALSPREYYISREALLEALIPLFPGLALPDQAAGGPVVPRDEPAVTEGVPASGDAPAGEGSSERGEASRLASSVEGSSAGEASSAKTSSAKTSSEGTGSEGVARLRRDQLIRLQLYQPLEEDPRMRVVGLTAQEPFMVYVKASLVAGTVIASPAIFFFIWDFVAAGLYRHERKYIYMYLPISLGLFLTGAALAFYVAFDYVLDFLFWFYQKMGVDPDPRLSEWISFVLILPLGFGISFQLPLVMLLLERIGVFSVEMYLSKWKIAILVICTLSMFLTPADPQSMLLMAIPLIGLYFCGILMCRLMPGRSERNKPAPRNKPATKSTSSSRPGPGGPPPSQADGGRQPPAGGGPQGSVSRSSAGRPAGSSTEPAAAPDSSAGPAGPKPAEGSTAPPERPDGAAGS
jgi:sec-independent protein translocase protein TatC